eukprot:1158780-Pelagomonas_calceolata.AAC.7
MLRKVLGEDVRIAYLVPLALVPSISRAEVMPDAVYNAKHEEAERASTSIASGAVEELPKELHSIG